MIMMTTTMLNDEWCILHDEWWTMNDDDGDGDGSAADDDVEYSYGCGAEWRLKTINYGWTKMKDERWKAN